MSTSTHQNYRLDNGQLRNGTVEHAHTHMYAEVNTIVYNTNNAQQINSLTMTLYTVRQ